MRDATLLISSTPYWIGEYEYQYLFTKYSKGVNYYHFSPVGGRRKVDKIISEKNLHKVIYEECQQATPSCPLPPAPCLLTPMAASSSKYQISAVLRQEQPFLIYTASLPYSFIAQMFSSSDPSLPPEERAQRIPDPRRAKKIQEYLVKDPWAYLPPMIVSADGAGVEFAPFAQDSENGILYVPLNVVFRVIDGQHRTMAVRNIIGSDQAANFTSRAITVDIIIGAPLELRLKIFRETNSLGKAVSRNLISAIGDDPKAQFASYVLASIPLFTDELVEKEKNALSKTSTKLFVYKHLSQATLLMRPGISEDADFAYCQAFWQTLSEIIPHWQASPIQVRNETIAAHGVVIHAFGELGKYLAATIVSGNRNPKSVKDFLLKLKTINWAKSNPDWLNRVVDVNGNLLAHSRNVKLMLNYLKVQVGVPSKNFSKEEKELERGYIGNLKLFGE